MIYILLPAYNEEEGLEKLLVRIDRLAKTFFSEYKLIIVNDGSSDHTVQVIQTHLKEMPIELINFEKNKGITEVFMVGFKRVCKLGKDNDICITLDSDNTQSPFVILDILQKLNERFDLVVASRFAKGGGMVGAPFFRKLLSLGVAYLLRKTIPIKGARDYSTFYRGYRVGLIRKAFNQYGDNLLEGHGFSGMANMLIRLCSMTDKVTEVGLVLRYDLKEGGSGMNILKTVKGYLKLLYINIRKQRNIQLI
ncbi:glycosyltransferase family 2 protein [candidate division KSB1 bacterium]|nr:glycosyltransferase family 2 protein [candidate division KSB1 bacterium]